MTHRGPDDAGEWWSEDGRVGLAHRRLSIIDLSPAGHQPMRSADGACTIVYNGEIYNFMNVRSSLERAGHKFRSNSDTEVIIASYREWGTDCLSKLNGMFAFALFDANKERLFVARDRAGEKPLYYAVANGSFRFASELKGLMADPSFDREINPEALDCYLAFGFVPGDLCMLQRSNKLPPAHALSFDVRAGTVHKWQYWNLPDCELESLGTSQDAEALVGELESRLHTAVRRQLVADVPVGVLLSGGVDSSLITALAARERPEIKTFTIRFPGHAGFDETEHARLIASHFGTQHIELEGAESTVDLMPALARQYDEPMADSSMVPTFIISKLVREHCKVALGGDGGDELFGGYAKYNRHLHSARRLAFLPQLFRTSLASLAETVLPVGFRGRNFLQQLATDFDKTLPLDGVHFDRSGRRSLTKGGPGYDSIAEDVWSRRVPLVSDMVQRATRHDFENYLPEKILVKVDRASMLNSLEVRAPFLDYQLVEFAFSNVPSLLKVSLNERKILLKKFAARLLPPDFDVQRKQGFSIPLASWLESGPWREFFHDVLTDTASTTFDRKAVASLLAGQAKGYSNSERLFSLVLLELWRKEYQI